MILNFYPLQLFFRYEFWFATGVIVFSPRMKTPPPSVLLSYLYTL